MAAHAAASQGKRVVILERFRIPRYKTCAGGLIGASLKALPAGFTPPVKATATTFTFAMRGRRGKTKAAKIPLITMVSRAEFDAQLVDAAVAAGATIYDDTIVTRLTADDAAVRISTRNRGDLCARVVVGADGSAGRTAAYVGVVAEQVYLGLELELVTPHDQAAAWANRVLVDWGTIPGGYAWVFPKGDSLTVGVISARGDGGATKRYLDDFIARLGLAGFEPSVSSGHLTRCRADDSPLSRGRVLVCGDAAGLLEPWTREGISYALRSGRLAGEWAVRIAEAPDAVDARRQALNYAFAVKAGLGVEMAVGRQMLALFERRPGLLHTALTTFPPAWNAFARVTRGATTLGELVRDHPMAGRWLAGRERV